MSGIKKTVENLQDLILRDQLTFICNRNLELFLCEREPKSLEQASRLADQYKEARYIDIVSLTFKTTDRSKSQLNAKSRSPSPGGQQMGRRGFPSNMLNCFNCGGPHLRRYCPQLKQGIMKACATQHRKGRSATMKVTFQQQDSEAQTVKEEMEIDQWKLTNQLKTRYVVLASYTLIR